MKEIMQKMEEERVRIKESKEDLEMYGRISLFILDNA